MDWQALFNIAVAIGITMGGWIVGRITKTLDTLDADIRTMPEKYVSKADFQLALTEIKALLHRIEDKLDGKEDKPR
jgi:hypothetical protein